MMQTKSKVRSTKRRKVVKNLDTVFLRAGITLIVLLGIPLVIALQHQHRAHVQTQKALAEAAKLATDIQQPANDAANLSDEAFAQKYIDDYHQIPSSLLPTIVAYQRKTARSCTQVALEASPYVQPHEDFIVQPGASLNRKAREQFVSMEMQQEDCEGGGEFNYVKLPDGWKMIGLNTGLGYSCDTLNRYHYSKEVLPECDASDSNHLRHVVPNTNP